ncbi:MAG TPA: TraR/DksA C4-type zinc finger protein [bacterium]|jgi:DnaK suppressor protein|nr:TraR/DksA C4-type zinc finger protein [bacterium]MDX9804730.1 TraR/DksA C4-type zinc finger protein [bacterium]HNW15085.1 TraR/DksA C4-type zinc finger protein [bacterium]HNZ53904.1 TraR/DksA C4-type zinc finger protein [bacterium]HOB72297.1 TraR/DksA C4-type zinc finger protein [bacterium]
MLTKKQLDKIKKLLNEELAEIEERNREKVNEMENEGDAETFHGDEADQANYLEHRNRLLRLRDRDRKLINKIRQTLEKIEEGEYGTCESCGCDIGFERLKLRPVASLCIECKQEEEEKEERDKTLKRR